VRSIRGSKGGWLPVAGALLATVAALAANVTPAQAAKPPPPPPPSSSLTFEIDSSCLVTVGYTWSGFKGKNLTAEYELVDHTGLPLDLGIAFRYDNGVSGTGSGSKDFQMTPNGSNPVTQFAAIGRLGKTDRIGTFTETVPDARATFSYAANPFSCGFPIT